MPTEKKNIYQKLLEIQKQINGLGKDKAAYGYKYVTGDKVLEHLKPLMNSLGLLLKQEVISIENTRQDYATKSGTTSEINSKVMMKFTWIDCETGDKEECLFGANGQNAWDKGVGSALTYGERYFLLKFFHIATDEDDIDNPDRKPAESVKAPQKPQQPAKTTPPAPAPITAQSEFEATELRPATSIQKEEIIQLLQNPVIIKTEREKMAAALGKLNEEQAGKSIQNLKDTIKHREAINAELNEQQ